ncbi:hypothetical protein GCK32_017151 [Trichostrongylus colubriformis]|uniref:Secreted protein n=1 Tax=Trichostrongylus colubriformis TaxID=6319 RepID=A0AAN8ILC2_TRICO
MTSFCRDRLIGKQTMLAHLLVTLVIASANVQGLQSDGCDILTVCNGNIRCTETLMYRLNLEHCVSGNAVSQEKRGEFDIRNGDLQVLRRPLHHFIQQF